MGIPTIAAAILAILASSAGQQVDQDRLTPGTITVEPANDRATAALGRLFADAVERALLEANFTALPDPRHSRYIARVTVTQKAHGSVLSNADEARPETSAGDWGLQFRMALPSSKTQARGLIVTRLTVEIMLRGSERLVWSGTALTAQAEGTRAGNPSAVAKKLADVLVQRFPDTVESPISVP